MKLNSNQVPKVFLLKKKKKKKKPENIIFNYLDVEGTHEGAKSFSFPYFVFPPSFPWGTLFGNLFLISGLPWWLKW